ncbi:ParB/RepB/Spo0J family partition protein [Inquilinus sp.]|jgi:ParB family chromosome partitioning protein|uniref:ParB/RepB/Spo0J family partition protein n=1 Tax=Inquilinus sp. TaxID=1932117 RepID=UPI0037838FD9
MAKAQKKLVLVQPRTIPLDRLDQSDANVRKVKKGLSIESLADDIDTRGLLVNLGARPVHDEAGQETDRFQVTYGGRRLAALQLLVARKRLAKDAPIPCLVRTEGIAEEDSLQENELHVGLHPLDQYRAFERLAELKFSDEEIAARNFVTLQVVQQRRRLARVSPKLLAIYEEDGMTLAQLQAFTIIDHHARQEAVWEAVVGRADGDRLAGMIRRALTETAVRATDPRVRFIGVEAYEAAGGHVRRDLFEQDQGGWLDDVALIDRLARAKLQEAAAAVAAEGWRWVEADFNLPYGIEYGLREIDAELQTLTDEQLARYEQLEAEIEILRETHLAISRAPVDDQVRWRALQAELDVLDDHPLVYSPEDMAIAGAFISLDASGGISIDRGFVREEDEPAGPVDLADGPEREPVEPDGEPRDPAVQRAVITIGGGPSEVVPEPTAEEEVVKPLPDVLRLELSAVRTVALQNAVARDPDVAMTLLLHKLCGAALCEDPVGSCLEVKIEETRFVVQNPELKGTVSAIAMAERRAAWKSSVPKDDHDRWAYLTGLDAQSRARLLAYLVSLGITAVDDPVKYETWQTSPARVRHRLQSADRLARTVGLDLVAEGWQPTADNYLNRVTKIRILDAVREGKGEREAQMIGHLKKGDMAREAERLLDGAGWLPEGLRTPPTEEATLPEGEGGDALPDFLSRDEGDPEPDGDAGDDEFQAAAE